MLLVVSWLVAHGAVDAGPAASASAAGLPVVAVDAVDAGLFGGVQGGAARGDAVDGAAKQARKRTGATDVEPGQLVLIGAGDIASCDTNDDDKTAAIVARVLAKSEKAWAFTLGDNVYPTGSIENFYRCYEPTWGRFKSRTLPAVGNHDWMVDNAAGFRSTFARRFSQDGPLWYSVDVEGTGADGLPASWHVVVLDSDCDKVPCGRGGPQHRWLQADLKADDAARFSVVPSTKPACTLALFHHPRFSSGPHGDAHEMSDLWELLDDAGVDLVLSGHDHTYERFPALTSQGSEVKGRGIPSVVVGSGGKSHYPIVMTRKSSLVHEAGTYGVLQLALDHGRWQAAFVGVDGKVRDVHEGTCR